MLYHLWLVDSSHVEATKGFKVQADSVRAVEVLAHKTAARHRQADPHDCRLDSYTIVVFRGLNDLPRIAASGGIHHGDWPE